jgi:sugar transferase (PEP-CTERM/EpsH1 system associated)
VSKIKGLSGFITNKPITLPYYFDKQLQQWTNRTIARHNIEQVFVYSSSMAQYVQDNDLSENNYSDLTKVIDFVDVDSDKWRQYADKKTGIAKWFFNREYKLLANQEQNICKQFTQSLFVSEDEAKLFKSKQAEPEIAKIHGLLNGVDVNFFDPNAIFSHEKLLPKVPFISFTGAMDYWANIDAVLWFVSEVWPLILTVQPETVFCIVGGNPSNKIKALAENHQSIIVTGRVHDVRPFIANAECVVAPLQIARGIQNKVLEAMSLNKAIVATSMAMEGINALPSNEVVITDDKIQFAQACLALIHNKSSVLTNRQWILKHFTWQHTLTPLTDYFLKTGVVHENNR